MSRSGRDSCVALFIALALAGGMSRAASSVVKQSAPSAVPGAQDGSVVVRYETSDVERAIAFYTRQLGFHIDLRTSSAVAAVSRGHLQVVLVGGAKSRSRIIRDSQRQATSGLNRVVLYVDGFASLVHSLRTAGVQFRSDVEVGPGGRLVQIEDPDGNPIELHESSAAGSR